MLNKKDIVFFYTKAKLEDDVFQTYMGFLWWLIDPALSALVYFLVFQAFLNRGGPGFISFLFIGIIVWKWFQSGVVAGASSILAQKVLFKRTYLPKIIFPWIEVGFTTIKFLVAFSLVILVYPLIGYPVTVNYAFLPILILCQFVFTLGIATFLSALTPFFPDLAMMISHFLKLAFYPSGILFSADRVPIRLRFIMHYNPMAQAVEGYRNIIMYGKNPPPQGMFLLFFLGLLFYAMGHKLIQKYEGKYAKIL